MGHKKKHVGVTPPGNLPPQDAANQGTMPPDPHVAKDVPSGQEQDPKRRLGDYGGKGEHPLQQPGGKNDANH